MTKYIDTDEANKLFTFILGERSNGKCAVERLIAQGREIERLRTTLGQCNTELNSALESLKSQCREIGKLKAEVKQAKIDVLCKLKQYSYCDNLFADGKWHRYVMVNDIEKLIEELKNEN